MNDLLSPEDTAYAQARGWKLCWVYILDAARWVVEVTPVVHPANSVADAQETVLIAARQNDSVAIRALQVVMQSLQPAPKKARKK